MKIKLISASTGITAITSPRSRPVKGITTRNDKADKTTHHRNALFFTLEFMSLRKRASAIAKPMNGMKPRYFIKGSAGP